MNIIDRMNLAGSRFKPITLWGGGFIDGVIFSGIVYLILKLV